LTRGIFFNLKTKKILQAYTWQNPNLTCVNCFCKKRIKKKNHDWDNFELDDPIKIL